MEIYIYKINCLHYRIITSRTSIANDLLAYNLDGARSPLQSACEFAPKVTS